MPATELREVIRGFRRDQVVTTALKLFGRAGSLDASMEEIAASAGISRSTIYNHFRDRDELLGACAAWSHGRLTAAMRDSIDHDAAPADLLAGFLEAVYTCLDENPGFYRLSATLRASVGGDEAVLGDQLAAAAPQSREQIDRLVERLVAADDVDVDVELAGSLLGMVLVGALQRRAAEAKPPPAAAAARQLADVLLHGLARR